jgi:hypothetical protein
MPNATPQIIVPVDTDGNISTQIRFLVVGSNGKAWAFARPEDAALDPLVGKALPLDPILIEEDPGTLTGKPSYRYRGVCRAIR